MQSRQAGACSAAITDSWFARRIFQIIRTFKKINKTPLPSVLSVAFAPSVSPHPGSRPTSGAGSRRDWLFHCGPKHSPLTSSRDKPSSRLCCCFSSIFHSTPTPSANVPRTQRVAGAGLVVHCHPQDWVPPAPSTEVLRASSGWREILKRDSLYLQHHVQTVSCILQDSFLRSLFFNVLNSQQQQKRHYLNVCTSVCQDTRLKEGQIFPIFCLQRSKKEKR